MQSNNPVFRRSEAFNGASSNVYGNQTYAGNGAAYPAYGQQGYADQGYGAPVAPTSTRPMTIDSVVQKTGISLAVVLVAAVATWVMTPAIDADTGIAPSLVSALTIGSLAAFGLSMVNSFKRVISPALVIAFCVAEGVALGALSKVFDAMFSTPDQGSIVTQAVLGTFAAFAGTLAAYKFFD